MARRTRIQRWSWAAAPILVALWPAPGAEAAFPGANGRIYFTATATGATAADVWSVSPDGSGLTDLTDLAGGPGAGSDPSVAPSGLVAFSAGAELWTMRADGSQPRQLTSDGFVDRMPAMSPDGSRIAYVTDHGSGPDVWTIGSDGSGARPLLTQPGDDLDPQYSADGNYVVVASAVSGNFDIALVPAAGGPYTSATSITARSPLDESTPAIQPDMVRLAYAQTDASMPARSDILTAYSNDGTDEFPLAVDPGIAERSPAFSPDGTQVVFTTGAGLVLAASGGASPQPLATPGVTGVADPDWSVGTAVDRTPPQTTITKAPKAKTERTTARFRFRSSEPGSSFECKLDRQGFKPCDSPVRYRRLQGGRHRFRVAATDATGNVDRSPAKAAFRVADDS